MRIDNCTSCKKDHADVSVTRHEASNGRPYVKYVCPETHKQVTRFVSGGGKTAPSRAGSTPGKGDTASGHATASGPGNDTNIHIDVNAGADGGGSGARTPRNRGGGAGRGGSSGGSMERRSLTLESETVRRVVDASGWDVAAGFYERLQELGVGSPSMPAILAQADDVAAAAHTTPTAAARKDSMERGIGRDLADIFVKYAAHARTDPQAWGNLYPKVLAGAWNADPGAFQRSPGGPSGAPSGGYGGGGGGGGGGVPDLGGMLRGDQPQGPQGPGSNGGTVGGPDPRDTDGDGVISFNERRADNPAWLSGDRLGRAVTGAIAGGTAAGPYGAVAGAIGGYVSPELADGVNTLAGSDNAAPIVGGIAAGAAGTSTAGRALAGASRGAAAGNQLQLLPGE